MKRIVIDLTTSSSDSEEDPNSSLKSWKKTKQENDNIERFYLTFVRELRGSQHNKNSITLSEILSDSLDLSSMVQINYMVDLDFIMSSISPPSLRHHIPVLVIHGLRDGQVPDQVFSKWREKYKNIRLHRQPLPFEYGTHHTKAMILFYGDLSKSGDNARCRIVIHTSNMVPGDWGSKTQGLWISPYLIYKQKTSCECEFEQDFIEYLCHYENVTLTLRDKLKKFDFTPIKAKLVASVPGKHIGKEAKKWGHLKLQSILSRPEFKENLSNNDYFIVQSSSIGNLGKSPSSWLTGQFLNSLNGKSSQASKIKFIFPTVDNVRNSFEGYAAGGSIPFDSRNKKPFLRNFFCKWSATITGRNRAMPHIKTYVRASSSDDRIKWFCLSSANMSKAAWGAADAKNTGIFIRNYELGVIVCTDNYDYIPVPYDLPPTPYSAEDEPWTWNENHLQPDLFGETWMA